MAGNWIDTKYADIDAMENAKEQMHQASQIAAAIGRTYLPKVKDDHFANFLWNEEKNLLQGHPIEADEIFCAGLSLHDLTIHLLNHSSDSIVSFALDGKTQKEAFIWLEGELMSLGLDGSLLRIELPYEIPMYDAAKGKPFVMGDTKAFEEVSYYFNNANLLVNEVIEGETNVSEVRCWPHHFDIASLITLNDTGNAETSTSIGVGLSPGDAGYNEPYFYLTPWPYPKVDELVPLEGPGNWHTDGWVGGVLKCADISGKADQKPMVKDFYQSGIDQLKGLLSH